MKYTVVHHKFVQFPRLIILEKMDNEWDLKVERIMIENVLSITLTSHHLMPTAWYMKFQFQPSDWWFSPYKTEIILRVRIIWIIKFIKFIITRKRFSSIHCNQSRNDRFREVIQKIGNDNCESSVLDCDQILQDFHDHLMIILLIRKISTKALLRKLWY